MKYIFIVVIFLLSSLASWLTISATDSVLLSTIVWIISMSVLIVTLNNIYKKCFQRES